MQLVQSWLKPSGPGCGGAELWPCRSTGTITMGGGVWCWLRASQGLLSSHWMCLLCLHTPRNEGILNHRISEPLRLEKSSKITSSDHQPTTCAPCPSKRTEGHPKLNTASPGFPTCDETEATETQAGMCLLDCPTALRSGSHRRPSVLIWDK